MSVTLMLMKCPDGCGEYRPVHEHVYNEIAALRREVEEWKERCVNAGYEITVTCYAGHSYQQEFGTCPTCRFESEKERDAALARVAVLEAALRRIASPSPDVGAFGDWQRGYCERGDMARACLAKGEGEP